MKYILSVLSFCILIVACEKEKGTRDGQKHPLTFSGMQVATVPVRALTTSPLPQDRAVRIVAYTRRAGESTANPTADAFVGEATYRATGADGLLTPCAVDGTGRPLPEAGQAMELESGTYDFYVYSDARPLADAGVSVAHGEDFLGAAVLLGVRVNGATQVDLSPLYHKCSKIQFTIRTAVGDQSVTSVQVAGGGIELSGLASGPLKYTLGGDLAGASDNQGSYVIPSSAFSYSDPADETAVTGTDYLLPKSSGDFGIALNLEINGHPRRFTAEVPATALDAGKHYLFLVELTQTSARLTLRVLPWNEATWMPDQVGAGTGFTVGEWAMSDMSDEIGYENPDLRTMSNCYMVVPGRRAIFPAAQANADGTKRLDLLSDWTAEVLWQTGDGTAPLISSVTVSKADGMITVETSASVQSYAGIPGGNAVVVVRQGGKIRWSWHIWVTDYRPGDGASVGGVDGGKVFRYPTGAVVMDRNLGALTSSAAMASFGAMDGLQYQWGRKDPFTSAAYRLDGSGKDGFVIQKIYDASGMKELAEETAEGIHRVTAYAASGNGTVNNLEYSVENPMHFLVNRSSSGTESKNWWYVDGPYNPMEWWSDTQKTPYDPCPEGWKVPSANGWFSAVASSGDSLPDSGTMKNVSATSSTVAYNAYSWDEETDIYPSVYYRYGFEESGSYIPTAQPPYHYQENILYPVFWNRYYGVEYHYWTTTTSGTSAKLVVQQNNKRYYGFQWLTQGLPVRCVKIQ